DPSKPLIYHVYADHLNTPRAIYDAFNKRLTWRWESEAFGNTLPDQDADKNGSQFVYHLRFPGQYWDNSIKLSHNWYRTYNPETGRYIQSDPIGLQGGVNTYGYVGGLPVRATDPKGLFLVIPALGCAGGGCEAGVAALCALTPGCREAVRKTVNACGEALDKLGNWIMNEGGAPEGSFPDRELPRDENGNPTPEPKAEGPHTQLGQKDGRKGKYNQGREFDANGKPVKDIDFTDHGRPKNHPNPHQHRYVPNPTGGTPQHGPAEPLL
uniref:RHS repeat-associated core domain-containing protein n=1 Tax=Chitinivorax sp. B TaxID=2502235 RepID=UPI0024B528BB